MILHESERLDFSRVPESTGIPKRVYWILVVGLIGIFMMGYLSATMAGFGHMWPANATMRSAPTCSSDNSQKCMKK
jgi:hypothetical protein